MEVGTGWGGWAGAFSAFESGLFFVWFRFCFQELLECFCNGVGTACDCSFFAHEWFWAADVFQLVYYFLCGDSASQCEADQSSDGFVLCKTAPSALTRSYEYFEGFFIDKVYGDVYFPAPAQCFEGVTSDHLGSGHFSDHFASLGGVGIV
jgi:hypothetical protein